MSVEPPRKPPPLPPRARAGGAPPPPALAVRRVDPALVPRHGENVSQAIKDQICEMALGLLEEQVQARIVHYRADLQTNPELDAITAEVVASLKEIQASAGHGTAASRDAIRDAHQKLLRGHLERVFRPGTPSLLVERRLKEITKKLARLFFQSELHEKTRGADGATKVIQHGEQAIYYLLARYKNRLENELGGFDYADDDVKERAFDLLAQVGKEMQDAFLARRSSELKRIVRVFQEVLVEFFGRHLAAAVPQLSEEVVVQAASFEGRAYSYKIATEAFPRFRTAFERRLMVRLVGWSEDQLIARLADTAGPARPETVLFVTDPRVFSMIVGEISEGLYEFLCNEGFLDLPTDWRQATSQAT
ncbi:Hypothetical protein A7982_01775 [Minicystis rosea]|nr:Hypothetical protein A7982_01775 [Minicystis rosea]